MINKKLQLSLLLMWGLLFVISFIAPRFIAPSGDGFTRGLNRLSAFFFWQLGAFIIAIALGISAWTGLKSQKGLKWLCSTPLALHLLSVVLVVGLLVYSNMRKPKAAAYEPPTHATTAVAEATPAATPDPLPETKSYQGIYRSGFEINHFYTMDGEGPWWMETNDEAHEKLQTFFVERPGRGGGITVALTVTAYVNPIGPGFNHLGPIDKKIHIVSIDSVRQLSPEEFDLVLKTIQK